jgi:hypothetical protein
MDPPRYDSLDGQVALVTGASRGIGAEIARQLHDLGATVYGGARDSGAVGEAFHAVALDVTDAAARVAVIERIEREADRLDVLVNNAGVYGPAGALAALDPDEVDETLAVNLAGPIHLTRGALPLLLDREGSRVVNVSSGAGAFADGIDSSHLPYGVSKAGLNAFTNGLAAQYPSLLANAVCPGWVRTEMGGAGAPRSVEEGAATPVWLARLRPGGPSGRFWRDRRVIDW